MGHIIDEVAFDLAQLFLQQHSAHSDKESGTNDEREQYGACDHPAQRPP